MALTLWLILLACAAMAWLLTWKEAARWLQWGFAVAFAAFAVWVVGTRLDTVTLWWPIVAVTLSLGTAFWSDARQRGRRAEGGPPDR